METKERESEVRGSSNEAGVICTHTRPEAIADRVLVHVSHVAKHLFTVPVLVTVGVWDRYVRVPEDMVSQNAQGRLWDLLWMAYDAIRREPYQSVVWVRRDVRNPDNGLPMEVIAKVICHDNGLEFLTIMLPDED